MSQKKEREKDIERNIKRESACLLPLVLVNSTVLIMDGCSGHDAHKCSLVKQKNLTELLNVNKCPVGIKWPNSQNSARVFWAIKVYIK